MKLRYWAAALALTFTVPPASAGRDADRYEEVVQSVASMVNDSDAQTMVSGKGLQLLNVTWEDTGRWEGSSLGPNISDVTIEVEADDKTHTRYLMPVMRHDNFTDKTGDVDLDKIYIPVGNEDGDALKTIGLEDFLADPDAYMSLPDKGSVKGGSLLAERDTHALVSAQHTFLPVPKDGKATFWPVIFNYQSYAENPAVLAILVTRQGTSMTIIDNQRDTLADGGTWGQRLYFNLDGEKAPLTAERLGDVKKKGKTSNGEDASTLGEDANLLMLIQVPLKQKEAPRMAYGYDDGDYGGEAEESAPSAKMAGGGSSATRDRQSDVDVAVLGHGDAEGPFTELDGLTIERDDRFPIRVTVQFYQATSNGVVSQDDIDRMAAQVEKVYEKAEYVGSLVVPAPTDKKRPTQWTGWGPAPKDLNWSQFAGLRVRYERYGWFFVRVTEPTPEPKLGIAD
jgi:hypothetical protein